MTVCALLCMLQCVETVDTHTATVVLQPVPETMFSALENVHVLKDLIFLINSEFLTISFVGNLF